MALRVAIVADDLTGALDAAAPFATRGLHTLVAATPDALDLALAEKPEVLAVNTVSRHASPQAAAARVRDTFQRLLSQTPDILLKKIDSTLRGPVGAEVAAAASSSQRRALICPAVPAQGRCVRHGRLLVNGRPLRETAAGRDPRAAVPEDDLAKLLETTLGETTVVDANGPWPRTDNLVADADTADALSSLARRMLPEARQWLPVGASGLAEALADTAFGPLTSPPHPIRNHLPSSSWDPGPRRPTRKFTRSGTGTR
ncbi:four-carbon acid sugar kinase family protein [Fodinicurvata halophila]|uniref:four-carbon acid sugar kinase family protein n=1 Tax=Fodinicurvata halophila TaxID=1419723 RepID=UPI0036440BBC